MKRTVWLFGLILAVGVSACSGGGGGGSSVPHSAPSPASAQGNHLAAADAQVFSPSSEARRTGQSVNLGNGGIPAVVGATSPYFGSILTQVYAWADDANNAPQPESTMSAVPANAVSGPVSIASVGQDNGNAFALQYHDFVVQLQVNKVGHGNIIVTFGDGTTGQIPVYVYDQWYLTCNGVSTPSSPFQWWYNNGVPTGQSGDDMDVNCATQTLDFPNGAAQITTPVVDSYGNIASAFTTVTAPSTTTSSLSVSVSSLALGTVYIVKLTDGGYAKVMPLVSDGSTLSPNVSGISLHDNPSGSGKFAF